MSGKDHKRRNSDRVFGHTERPGDVRAVPVTLPPQKMLEVQRCRHAYDPIRNIKAYCDRKHNGFTWKQIKNKYGIAESTAAHIFSGLARKILAWKGEGDGR